MIYPESELGFVSPHDTGLLKIKQLKRFWQTTIAARNNDKATAGTLQNEWQLNKTLLAALGLGLEQALCYLNGQSPSFKQFEEWIINTAGQPDTATVQRYNNLFDSQIFVAEPLPAVLTIGDLAFFEKNGYVVLKNAIPKADCEATVQLICDYLGILPDNTDTWYRPRAASRGIWVQLFQHPQLKKNRHSQKIQAAFEQLWKKTNLWVNTDQVGFNPPETQTWQFPGPHLHWDCSLAQPVAFGLQGILYLADTAANQGAFTVVPGFQHKIENWLNALPPGAEPRQQDLHALGSQPIAGQAGDFIIWLTALPHGSSPNTSQKPRFVQYICYEPADHVTNATWR